MNSALNQSGLVDGFNKENEIQLKLFEMCDFTDDKKMSDLVEELDKRI